jgi:hypothetical protein
MRADIHGGPEHTLQSEAGYIDARPKSRQIDQTSCDARPDHTIGSIAAAELRGQRRQVLLNKRTPLPGEA